MLQWPGVMSWLLSVSQSTDWPCYNDLESYLGCCQSVSLLIDHATMTWSHILVVVSQSVYWLTMLQWPGVISWLLSVSQSTDWPCYNDLESCLGCCQSVSLLIGHATMTWSHILVVVSQSVYWLTMLQWPGVISWLLSVSLLIGHATMTWSHILVVVSQYIGWLCYNDLESSWLLSVSLLVGHATDTWSHVLVVVSQSTGWSCYSDLDSCLGCCRSVHWLSMLQRADTVCYGMQGHPTSNWQRETGCFICW